jgi:hypothetical protein
MHAYDWLLIDWLAGGEKPLEFFFAGWPADERRTSNWALLLDLVHGYRSGDHGPGLERLAAWPRPESTWAEHHYWAARSLLERAEPEPAKALEEIARGRSKIALSRYLPIEALRLRAEGMSGRQRLTAASFDGALEGLRRLAERSGSDIRAMIFLPLAARDLARAAGLAGQAQLAGEIEREFLKAGSARRIVGPGPSIGGGAEVRSRNIGGR